MSDYTIKDFTTKQSNRGMFSSDMQVLYSANVKFPGHGFIGVSRWHDEPYWVVDCRFGENGMPFFSNGEGVRVTMVQPLTDDHPITLELDAMMEAVR